MSNNELVRIQKIMADAGVASRRKAEELIKNGAVRVNGNIANLGDKANPKKDEITVYGKKIASSIKSKKYYIMLHKPRGYITTMSDERDRKCVAQLISDFPARLYPIGRLDRESEGLLLMTNDGDFANEIIHPSHHVAKTYRVTVHPRITEEQLTALTKGVLVDGRLSSPAGIKVLTQERERTVLEIILEEGRNRQIRKMCEAVGLEVARLKRTAIGPIKLGMLQPGKYRELTTQEMKAFANARKKADNSAESNKQFKASRRSKNDR